MFLPVLGELLPGFTVIGSQDTAVRMLLSPKRERQLIVRYGLEMLTLGRAKNCFSSDLLPPRPGFFVLHDEVLVIDPR
jgi:hypothetical protein